MLAIPWQTHVHVHSYQGRIGCFNKRTWLAWISGCISTCSFHSIVSSTSFTASFTASKWKYDYIAFKFHGSKFLEQHIGFTVQTHQAHLIIEFMGVAYSSEYATPINSGEYAHKIMGVAYSSELRTDLPCLLAATQCSSKRWLILSSATSLIILPLS